MRQRAAQATVESAPDGAARPIAEMIPLRMGFPLGSRLGLNDRRVAGPTQHQLVTTSQPSHRCSVAGTGSRAS